MLFAAILAKDDEKITSQMSQMFNFWVGMFRSYLFFPTLDGGQVKIEQKLKDHLSQAILADIESKFGQIKGLFRPLHTLMGGEDDEKCDIEAEIDLREIVKRLHSQWEVLFPHQTLI